MAKPLKVWNGSEWVEVAAQLVDASIYLTSATASATYVPNSVVTAKGDLIVASASATVDELSVGADKHRIVADSGEALGLKYVADTTNYAVGAKGDLLVGTSADTLTNLGVGTNGQVLTADSAETSGVKWADPASSAPSFTTQTASYTPSLADANGVIEFTAAATLTVPSDSSTDFPEGTELHVLQSGTGAVSIASDSGVTIRNAGFSLTSTAGQWTRLSLLKRATDEWVLFGDFIALAGRGLFGGGDAGSGTSNTIDYIEISTTGNATDFGDLSVAAAAAPACASEVRGLWCGGYRATASNIIDYVTIASAGNASDFGDLTYSAGDQAALSNNTRGVIAGGWVSTATINFVTIASIGNAVFFGNLSAGRGSFAAAASSTRGIFAGARWSSNIIDYVTIASLGNAIDFGDLTVGRGGHGGFSSTTRAVFGGGDNTVNTGAATNKLNVIDYITIATTGNATDFGDLSQAREATGGCSTLTRGVFGGGRFGSLLNIIDYVTIATTGNATDFGDLTVARLAVTACSNGHGGLA